MTIYAICDIVSPHVIRAFVNNDPPAQLPGNALCRHVFDSDVESGAITIGMSWPPGDSAPHHITKTMFDGADFLSRLTNDEYAAITASSNIQVRRWLDIFRLRGEIDVSGATAQAAKAGLVAMGLLTAKRADEIFSAQ